MSSTANGGFGILRENIIRAASEDLEGIAPDSIAAFRKAYEAKRYTEAAAEVGRIQTGAHLKKWRDICTRLFDVELAIHQLNVCLNMLGQPAPSYITPGEWVTYHFDSWTIRAQGLLNRFEKLTTKVVRELVKPSTGNFKEIENEIRAPIQELKGKVAVMRDTVAHGGGLIDVLGMDGFLERILLIKYQVDFREILAPMATYQTRWHVMLHGISTALVTNIHMLSERLNAAVPWPSTSN